MAIELVRKPAGTGHGGEIDISRGTVSDAGAWTFGAVGGLQSHTFRGANVRLQAAAGNDATLRIQVLDNTSVSILDFGDAANDSAARILYSHTTDSFYFRTGASGTDKGVLDSAGAWTLGAAGGTQLHQINGNARFETSGATNQAVILRSGASATLNDLQFYAANSAANTAKNRLFAEIVAAQDSGSTPVFQYYVGRDTNAAITTRPLFSWVNFTTERGRVDADGTWRNTAGTWSTLSDSRLKQNVQTLTGALDVIVALRPVSFEWINEDQHDISPTVSFLAQEVEVVRPSWVSESAVEGEDATLVTNGRAKQLTMGYDMQAYLVAAIKELKQQFDNYVAAHP